MLNIGTFPVNVHTHYLTHQAVFDKTEVTEHASRTLRHKAKIISLSKLFKHLHIISLKNAHGSFESLNLKYKQLTKRDCMEPGPSSQLTPEVWEYKARMLIEAV